LSGGAYIIGGNFLYDCTTGGAAGQILAIAAGTELALVGNGQVLTGGGNSSNALASLQENDGVFNLLGATEFTTPGTGVFENAAGASLLLETGTLFATNLQNDGIASIDPSSVDFPDTYTQSNGNTTVDGAIVASSGVSVTGGLLNGTGTVDGDVTQSGGTVQPGDAPGVLSITGDYTQEAAGTLEIDFTGRGVPGSDWGLLTVGGVADLSGQIDVVLPNAIDFQAGDVFDIVSAGSVINGGVQFDLPGLSNGLEWVPVFQSGELDLNVDAESGTPEPSTWAMLAAGLALLLWRRGAAGLGRPPGSPATL